MPNFITEDQIEKAAVALLKDKYGYRTVNCYTADVECLDDESNRASKQQVVFLDILKSYLIKLNPTIPELVVEQAMEKLTARRYAMSPILANKEVYGFIRDGIPVEYEDAKGRTEHGTVKVIDFANPQANDFCAVTQLWVKGERYPRRPDILIYINGLPLVFIELKNSNVKVRNAFDDNLTNYKHDIPLLFLYNAFCVLSNAIETKIGSFTAGFEFFFNAFFPRNGCSTISRTSFSIIKTARKSWPRTTIFLARKIFHKILEDENLDEQAQEKLEKEYSTELEIIKRDDRLETIARDMVFHFPRRGYLGKGMMISVDKYTCVKMFDKVQKHWKDEIKRLVGEVSKATGSDNKERLQRTLEYMRKVEMAVVVSEDAGEEERFTRQGLDIKPHRKKINAIDVNGHDIEYRFKDPEDKLQLVFVCAMWLTGFDAPTVSTLYLDKPMKDHTLMQTIARANRVTSHTINKVTKANGEIVDYYNVFQNMKKALADFAIGDDKNKDEPVQDKGNLFTLLDDALLQGSAFCKNIGIRLQEALEAGGIFSTVGLFRSFADALLVRDTHWKEFKVYENTISSLYEACKPEILAGHFRPLIAVFQYLRGVVDGIIGESDIEEVKQKISELLDQSIVTTNERTFIKEQGAPEYQRITRGRIFDLSKLDFNKLKEDFKTEEFKNIEIADLRVFIEKKLEVMLLENSTRSNIAERLQAIIDRYNAGGTTTEDYYSELVDFAEKLKEEDERHIKEGLTKEELELFDILKKDKMAKGEEIKVKNAAKDLLRRLLKEQPPVLIQDWYKDSQSQLRVKTAVDEVLDKNLPETYDLNLFKEKSARVFELIYEYAAKGLKWAA